MPLNFIAMVDITRRKIQEYADAKRIKAGAARASVNRELAYLRRGIQANG